MKTRTKKPERAHTELRLSGFPISAHTETVVTVISYLVLSSPLSETPRWQYEQWILQDTSASCLEKVKTAF